MDRLAAEMTGHDVTTSDGSLDLESGDGSVAPVLTFISSQHSRASDNSDAERRQTAAAASAHTVGTITDYQRSVSSVGDNTDISELC